VSLAIRASSERILSRESARSRAHSRTAVTTESQGDPFFRDDIWITEGQVLRLQAGQTPNLPFRVVQRPADQQPSM
jgi:hypothetical protein